jgi:hypothetical protein
MTKMTITNHVLLQNQITKGSRYKFLAVSIQTSVEYNENQERLNYYCF